MNLNNKTPVVVTYAEEGEETEYFEIVWNDGYLSDAKYTLNRVRDADGKFDLFDKTFFDTVNIIKWVEVVAERESKNSRGKCLLQKKHYLEFHINEVDTVVAVILNIALLEQVICTCDANDVFRESTIESIAEYNKNRSEIIAKAEHDHQIKIHQ
jgi:hypothetical protein